MDSTEEIFQSCNNVVLEETSNVISKDNNHTLQYEQIHNVVLPSEEQKIAINISVLKKIKNECDQAKKHKFSYAEVWLGISTLLLGGFFSAIMSKIPYELNFLSILFYTICPVGGVGFGIAYFFCREKENQDATQLAERIEGYLPDAEEIGGFENEYK